MKRFTAYLIPAAAVMAALLSLSCEQTVDYVDATWARPVSPAEGSTLKIDFFKPDDKQVFTWEVRPGATYKIAFDVDMHFENAYVYDMGQKDSLVLTNSEMLDMLRTVWPDFSGVKRFFWRVEQTRGSDVRTSWRYFSAIPLVESFTDARDGEVYGACQFILNDGSLMTIMSENLRATVYADGEPLPVEAKAAAGDGYCSDPLYVQKVGRYYSWAAATRLTWDEAKTAYEAGQTVQGVCPDGWHLPSMDEFNALREYLGADVGANAVKDPSYWPTAAGITNSAKMNIVVSGFYWHEGLTFLTDPTFTARFWTSTPRLKGMQFAYGDSASADDPTKAVLLSIYDDASTLNLQSYSVVPWSENHMYPVRCVMDPM